MNTAEQEKQRQLAQIGRLMLDAYAAYREVGGATGTGQGFLTWLNDEATQRVDVVKAVITLSKQERR